MCFPLVSREREGEREREREREKERKKWMNKRMSACMTIPRGHHFFPTFQSGQVNTEQGRVPVLHDNGVLQTMSEELEKQSQIDYKNKIKAGMPENIKGFVKPFCCGGGGGGLFHSPSSFSYSCMHGFILAPSALSVVFDFFMSSGSALYFFFSDGETGLIV